MQLSESESLKLFIRPKANPVIVHSSQSKFTVSGGVSFVCREYLPFSTIVNVELQVVKTAHCFQMGGESAAKQTLFKAMFPLKLKRILPKVYGTQHPIVNPCRAYTKPFDFILDTDLLPTLLLPKCSVVYLLTASLEYSSIPHSLRIKLPKNVEAKQTITVIDSSVTRNLINQANYLQPIIRKGTLHSDNPIPFTIVVDKGIACPGDLVRLHIVVDPPSRWNGNNAASMGSEYSSSTQSLIPGSTMPHKRHRKGLLAMSTNLQSKGNSSFEQIPQLTGVSEYKISITLVQIVTLTNVHSSEPGHFKTREQTVCAKETKSLDLSHVINGIHMDCAISLSAKLQHNVQTTNAHVCYKIIVDFFPRLFFGGVFIRMAKAACSWLSNNRASTIEMPLLVLPIPASTLMENPPSYSP
ncbi:hypothetical protein BX667DRAFT_498392 [Coemansia mojavensis]|nr:hypothetical protein BX667DRAFT_498392 [Coemansia mojavensis]